MEDLESTSEITVRRDLTQVFRRLDMQATTFMDSRQPLINATTFGVHLSEKDSPTPVSFSSLQEAQEELDRIGIRLVYVLTLKSPAKDSTQEHSCFKGLQHDFILGRKLSTPSQSGRVKMDTKDLRLSVMLGLHFQTGNPDA